MRMSLKQSWTIRRLGFLVLALSIGLAGCGPSIPKTYPVSGKVVAREGKKEVKLRPGSMIIFKQVADDKVVADGQLDASGNFKLTTKMFGKGKEGAVPGDYKVMIQEEGTAGPDGQLAFRPIFVDKTYTVEPKDNLLTIEAEKVSARR